VKSVYCNMCNSETGMLFSWCAECPIRKCGIEKGYTTCAECKSYPCDHLSEPHKRYPEQKENLDAIRKTLSK
jgi:hypothetical protein